MEKHNLKAKNVSLLQLIAAGAIVLLLIALLSDPFGIVTGFIDSLK